MPFLYVTRFFILLLVAAGILSTHAAASDGILAIGVVARYHDVEEVGQSGAPLVQESGWEPAIELGGKWPVPSGALIGKILMSRYALDYEGRSQLGRSVDSETDYRRIRVGLGYSHGLTETTKVSLQFERESLERDINSVGNIAGLNEKTESNRLLLGVEKVLAALGRPISLEWAGVLGLSGTQKVASPGVIDEVRIPEGRTYGIRVAATIPLGSRGERGWSWALTPTIEYLHSKRSEDRPWTQNGAIRGILAQPETRRWAFGVGLMAMW